MPSDPFESGAAPRGRIWGWLFSQGLGVLCGQTTAVLLATGSIVLAATRDGASAGIRMDDLRIFFVEPSIVHLWFYLLVPTLGLYGLNTVLATWENVSRKWRLGMRSPGAYATAVIHVSFLVALLAHVVGGLWGTEQGQVIIGPTWKQVGEGRQARLAAMKIDHLPDGSLKQVRAQVEVKLPGGNISESTVGYNGPISSGLGESLLLLVRPAAVPGALHLARGHHRCRLNTNDGCDLGDLRIELLYLHPPPSRTSGELARLRFTTKPDGPTRDLWLMRGHPAKMADGSSVVFERVESQPAVLMRGRHAPGNPWALFSALTLVVGLALMWRRFLR